MPGYASIESKKAELIRKGIQGSVFVAPYTAAPITTSIFGTTGDLATLPAGYFDIGWTDDTGAVFARKVTTTDVSGWGSIDPLRMDITADTTTLEVTGQQTNLTNIGLMTNTASSALVALSNGSLFVPVPVANTPMIYRVLAVGIDETPYGEIVFARYLPNAQVTDYKSQGYSMKDPLLYGFVFTANLDSTAGFAQEMIYGGAGWLYMLTDAGVSRGIVCTVALTTTLIATTGSFSADDVGATVSGVGLIGAQTIVSLTNSTTAVLSAVGTTAGTLVPVTVSNPLQTVV